MSEIETFKATVEAFIAANEMTPTVFGKKFAGDPLFVFDLRKGREPRYATRCKVLDAMQAEQERAA
jgi:predicted transcriptional regulator